MKCSHRLALLASRLKFVRVAGMALAVFAGTALIPAANAQMEQQFTPLFNGQNLNGWYTWDNEYKKNNDVENYFQVQNGELVILDIPESDENKAFGYLSTNAEYADYHLRFQYQWGQKKYAPRKNLLRDSGLLYHFIGNDRIWPTSLESQVQEGDTGDFFGLGGARVTSTAQNRAYAPGGNVVNTGNLRASEVADTLTGWNTSEVVVRGNSAVHIVNGKVVNRIWNARVDGTDLSAGRIAFQAEGATVRYRNIEIRPLKAQSPRVLLFSETRGFQHRSIPDALAALEELASSVNFQVDLAGDSNGVFTDANLANYDAVVWVMTTGDVLNTQEQEAFEHYIRSGGGYVGIHAASDTEYDWPWYGELVGAYFARHPAVQSARQFVEDGTHPSTEHLGSTWTRTDEWYDYRSNPRGKVNVLLSLDESSYSGGRMGEDHPSAWFHEFDGGRSWYTGGGHTSESYSEPDFRAHLLGGLQYAVGERSGPGGTPIPTATPTATPAPGSPSIPADALDRSAWTVSASASRSGQGPGNAIDGDSASRWSTGITQRPGMSFDIDFGELQSFDGIVLDAGPQGTDYPRGYEVRISNDGTDFSRLVASGSASGRGTVINFPAVAAQFVRIVQTGSDNRYWWSIHEINVSGADTGSVPPTIPSDALDRAAWTVSASNSRSGQGPSNAIDGDPDSRWSTGSVQAPGMRFDMDFGKTENFDAIVLDAGPAATDYPRGYEVRISDDGADFSTVIASGEGSGRGTVISFAPVSAQFVRIVQTGSDNRRWWSIHEINVSGAQSNPDGTALEHDSWSATASSSGNGESPSDAFDASPSTRWSTGARQVPGQFFQVDLGEAREFDRLLLATSNEQPFDYPRAYEVFVSNDGSNFGSPVASGAGSATTDIRFADTSARYIRIVQTGEHGFRWWSIYDMQIFVDSSDSN